MGAGSGISVAADSVAGVDSTVIRTTGNQTKSGSMTFSDSVTANGTINVNASTGVKAADNKQFMLGSGSDFRMFFNGSNTYFDMYSGNLYIRDSTTTRFTFDDNGNFFATGGGSQLSTGFSVSRGIGSVQRIQFTMDASGNNIRGQGSAKKLNFFNDNAGYGHHFYTAYSTSSNEMKERFKIDNNGGCFVVKESGSGSVDAQLSSTGRIVRKSSDRNLKEDIFDLPNMTESIKALRPRRFHWKDKVEMGDHEELGFIAQEVQGSSPNCYLCSFSW